MDDTEEKYLHGPTLSVRQCWRRLDGMKKTASKTGAKKSNPHDAAIAALDAMIAERTPEQAAYWAAVEADEIAKAGGR